MDGKGDLNLAKQLQAEFGKAKSSRQPRQNGKSESLNHYWPPLEPVKLHSQPSQVDSLTVSTGSNGYEAQCRGKERMPSANRPFLPEWRGNLVTSDSPGKKSASQDKETVHSRIADAAMFFRPQNPRPPKLSTAPQAPTHASSSVWSQDLPQAVKENVAHPSGLLRRTTGQPESQLLINTARSVASDASPQPDDWSQSQQEDGFEQTKMEGVQFSSPMTPDHTVTGPRKGLSASRWNPANRDVHADIRARQAHIGTPSNTSSGKKANAEAVTSGLVKGPGLSASR